MPDWIYDPRLQGSGYRDTVTGRILSYDAVQGMILDELAGGYDVSGGLSGMVAGGNITPASWRDAFKQEIKDQYIAQYLLGRGGRDMMNQSDWGSVGGMIADQYRYLNGFYNDLITKDLTEGQINARMNMYINSARESYERANRRTSLRRGFTTKHWEINTAIENCDDCLSLESLGDIPIEENFESPSTGNEAIPGNGQTICLTNCGCHISYGDRPSILPKEGEPAEEAEPFGPDVPFEEYEARYNEFVNRTQRANGEPLAENHLKSLRETASTTPDGAMQYITKITLADTKEELVKIYSELSGEDPRAGRSLKGFADLDTGAIWALQEEWKNNTRNTLLHEIGHQVMEGNPRLEDTWYNAFTNDPNFDRQTEYAKRNFQESFAEVWMMYSNSGGESTWRTLKKPFAVIEKNLQNVVGE